MKYRRSIASVIGGFLVAGIIGCSPASKAQTPSRAFATNSPWNLPITAAEENASFANKALAAFNKTNGSVNLNLDVWTTTLLTADKSTPRFTIKWSQWQMNNVPVPPSIFPALTYLIAKKDTDRGICINDTVNNVLYSFWSVNPDPAHPGSISVQAGGSFSPTGSGWWDDSHGNPWTGRASGASLCGGLITPLEMEMGNIPHALSAGWPHSLILARNPVFPATSTDGGGIDPDIAIPMGTRLQLDPKLTDLQMQQMGLKKGDITIAHAMQKYGVYIVDSSGAFSIDFVSGLGQGRVLYPNVTGLWPHEIMSYFHATTPVTPAAVAPFESRATRGEPILLPKL